MFSKIKKSRAGSTTQPPKSSMEVFNRFMLFKQSNAAPRTLKDYKTIVGNFLDRYCPEWDYAKLEETLLAYFSQLNELSPATYNVRLRALKAFFNWCVNEARVLPANPVGGLRLKRYDEDPRGIDDKTLQKLLKLPDRKTYVGIRDYALLLLQVDTGIRPGEALQLRPPDFNLEALEVTIPNVVAKARKSRTIIYSHQVAKTIMKLLQVRPPDWDNTVPVFASRDGTQLGISSWARRLQIYYERLGIQVTPYMLRHTAAYMFLRNGGDVFNLQRELGHANLKMTERYLRALNKEDLRRVHGMASPVAAILPNRTRIDRVEEAKPSQRTGRVGRVRHDRQVKKAVNQKRGDR